MDILSVIENNIITIVGILIPTIIAIILYLKGRKVKKPIYFLKTFDIASRDKDIPKLKLIYEDRPIETLSITRIAILNDGNETIDCQDVAKKDPLRIEISKNFKILDADFHYIRTPANDFSLETIENQNNIKINFDYIDGREGCIIQVIHDGAKSDDISVAGSIKGAGEIVQRDINKNEEYSTSDIIFKVVLISIFGFVVITLLQIINYYNLSYWLILLIVPIGIILVITLVLIEKLIKFYKDHIYFYELKM